MRHTPTRLAIGAAVAAMALAACGTPPTASVQSPAATTPTPSAPADFRLVIEDFGRSQVRLARLDATDTAKVTGHYDGIAGGVVIVLNGTALEAVNRNGTVTKLGQLVAAPDWVGPGTVLVSPDLSRWIYTIRDAAWTGHIHLGTPTSDRVIASTPSPDGDFYYRGFAWNTSGIYLVRQAVGLGGAGPFLDYHFPLATLDLATSHITDLSPQCIVYQVLDDGTMVCGRPYSGGRIEIRSPSGQSNEIQLAIGGGDTDDAYISVLVSADNKRLIAGRNGSKDPVIHYQMAITDLTSSSAQAFGPLDYLPDAWLPDGRVVAEHTCAYAGWGGGPCSASIDGTYLFSADGTSRTLFYKLVAGAVVVGYV